MISPTAKPGWKPDKGSQSTPLPTGCSPYGTSLCRMAKDRNRLAGQGNPIGRQEMPSERLVQTPTGTSKGHWAKFAGWCVWASLQAFGKMFSTGQHVTRFPTLPPARNLFFRRQGNEGLRLDRKSVV